MPLSKTEWRLGSIESVQLSAGLRTSRRPNPTRTQTQTNIKRQHHNARLAPIRALIFITTPHTSDHPLLHTTPRIRTPPARHVHVDARKMPVRPRSKFIRVPLVALVATSRGDAAQSRSAPGDRREVPSPPHIHDEKEARRPVGCISDVGVAGIGDAIMGVLGALLLPLLPRSFLW